MGRNVNYNRNRNSNISHNNQDDSNVHGGEFRKGRLSQYKNNNPLGQEYPNEYVSALDEDKN
ncbi:hypothetical protein DNH61_02320 [Paenibacillus sambharensis]|uniref:Uncharacterized protein n=1 Tax=Paenibacillus sambharensis TaxID=1803190 RepID=A0A2W1LRR9_9BACL|nr:hypothetical protein DNH61_02320 [Paenibacillus sambharensis]